MKKLFCKDIQFVYKRIRKRVPIKHKNRRRIKISNSFCFVNVIIDSVEIKIWVNFFIFCKILVFSAESFTSMTVLWIVIDQFISLRIQNICILLACKLLCPYLGRLFAFVYLFFVLSFHSFFHPILEIFRIYSFLWRKYIFVLITISENIFSFFFANFWRFWICVQRHLSIILHLYDYLSLGYLICVNDCSRIVFIRRFWHLAVKLLLKLGRCDVTVNIAV